MMPPMKHTLRRADLAENTVIGCAIEGARCLIVDIDGQVHAFRMHGPAARSSGLGTVAEGRLRCPLHGWPIDLDAGRCGAVEYCRYERLAVDVRGEEIHVHIPTA